MTTKAEQMIELKKLVDRFNKRIVDLKQRAESTSGVKSVADSEYVAGAQAVLSDLEDIFPEAFK